MTLKHSFCLIIGYFQCLRETSYPRKSYALLHILYFVTFVKSQTQEGCRQFILLAWDKSCAALDCKSSEISCPISVLMRQFVGNHSRY